MKLRRLFFSCLLLLTGFGLQSNDYFLLPEIFMLHKGETINVHMLTGKGLEKDDDEPYRPSQTAELMLYEGKQKTDLKAGINDSATSVFT